MVLRTSQSVGCCQACGQQIPLQQDVANEHQTNGRRRSSRLASTINKVATSSSSDYLCQDCVEAVNILATQEDCDLFDTGRSIDETDSSNVKAMDKNYLGNVPVKTPPVEVPTFHSGIKSDVDCDQSQTSSTESNYNVSLHGLDNSIPSAPPNENATIGIGEEPDNIKIQPTIVSPETSTRAKKCSKICRNCSERTVPEEIMDYCKRCYAIRATEREAKLSLNTTTIATATNRCRLCTGIVHNTSHQYCLKCYLAKQRDDAKREQMNLHQKLKEKTPPKKVHVPYVCIDCGIEHNGASWKTKCRPCYIQTRGPKRPKLMPKVVKKLFDRKLRRR
jgi:hypothetical protein